jgi:hypothetical protein
VAVVLAVLILGGASAHAASNSTTVSHSTVFQQSYTTFGASTTSSPSSSRSPLNPLLSAGGVVAILAVGAFLFMLMMRWDRVRNNSRDIGLLAIGFVGGVILAAIYIGAAWSSSISAYTERSALITNAPGYAALMVIMVLGLFALRGERRGGK